MMSRHNIAVRTQAKTEAFVFFHKLSRIHRNNPDTIKPIKTRPTIGDEVVDGPIQRPKPKTQPSYKEKSDKILEEKLRGNTKFNLGDPDEMI